jgi:hypothetical protein
VGLFFFALLAAIDCVAEPEGDGNHDLRSSIPELIASIAISNY